MRRAPGPAPGRAGPAAWLRREHSAPMRPCASPTRARAPPHGTRRGHAARPPPPLNPTAARSGTYAAVEAQPGAAGLRASSCRRARLHVLPRPLSPTRTGVLTTHRDAPRPQCAVRVTSAPRPRSGARLRRTVPWRPAKGNAAQDGQRQVRAKETGQYRGPHTTTLAHAAIPPAHSQVIAPIHLWRRHGRAQARLSALRWGGAPARRCDRPVCTRRHELTA